MKIFILTNHSYMLYRFRKELIQELRKDHEVVLCMPFVGHEDDFQAMGFRCINTDLDRRGTNPLADIHLMMQYRALLAAERPDLVITYSIKPNIYAGLVCTMLKIPFCANVQGLGTAFQRKGLAGFVSVLYKLALHNARTVFFENEGNAREFLTRRIVARDQAVLLAGAGINLQEYPYKAYPDQDQFHFLYLGRIMKEKGIDELFEAMRKLHTDFGSQVVLDLVGFFDDDYAEEVRSLAEQGVVTFHGFQTDPRPYYEMTDCVVLPSYHEGMSNVLLEASAMGRPVITSDIPGCREAVDHGETGLLCQVKSAVSLYQQMMQMVSEPREKREQMGINARQKMEKEFEKSLIVQNTIRHLF